MNQESPEHTLTKNQLEFLKAYTTTHELDIQGSCKAAGISKITFYSWLKKSPRFNEFYIDARNRFFELAEANVRKALKSDDNDMTKFVLTKLGRYKDWNPVNNVDITSGGNPIPNSIKIEIVTRQDEGTED